jgi:hypothetical protein
MNLKQLYKTTNWGEVKDFLLQLYPDQKKNVAGYEKVYTDLAQIEPEETALELFLRYIEEENPEDSYHKVSGIDTKRKESYSLMLTSWKEWLGMTITQDTLKNYSPSEVMAHCLNEMTYIGFDSETRKKSEREINKKIDLDSDEWEEVGPDWFKESE